MHGNTCLLYTSFRDFKGLFNTPEPAIDFNDLLVCLFPFAGDDGVIAIELLFLTQFLFIKYRPLQMCIRDRFTGKRALALPYIPITKARGFTVHTGGKDYRSTGAGTRGVRKQ